MGEIRKERVYGNFKQKTVKKKRDRPGMSADHLNAVRNLPCCVCFLPPRSEAHHLKQGTGERGMGMRSSDQWAIPLCRTHHHEIEHVGSRNEIQWFEDRGINALDLAKSLWIAEKDLRKMQDAIDAIYCKP